MQDRTSIKCQKCKTEIPLENVRLPCPKCGEMGREYSSTLIARVGLVVKISDNVRRITFPILYALIILGALAYYFVRTFVPMLDQNLAFWIFIGFNILVLIFAFVLASIKIHAIEKIEREKPRLDWKSTEWWISRLKPGAVLFLFDFISLYLVTSLTESNPKLDFVIISATFGGLVLAAASFQKDPEIRGRLMQVAKLFILATVLLIVFIATDSLLELAQFNPSQFECTLDWILKEAVFLVFVVGGMALGVWSFSQAIIDLLDWFRKN